MLATAAGAAPRQVGALVELTSREPSSKIPEHLTNMGIEYPDPNTIDVILATNMIAVGVDVDRLGLMAVMGQPPSTSEYIQATSRVGRQYPGLVLALFNAARSRDRSHYESFVTNHASLYKQVESTSVTPFSARARDRGLAAVVIAIARLRISGLRDNRAARDVAKFPTELAEVKKLVLARVAKVAPQEATNVAREIDTIFERWKRRAVQAPNLHYSKYLSPDDSLLVDASSDMPEGDSFKTLWSLRDVDQPSNLFQVSRL